MRTTLGQLVSQPAGWQPPIPAKQRRSAHASIAHAALPPPGAEHAAIPLAATPGLQEEAAALWDSLSHGALFGLSSAATTGEVAAVILIKLLMDLYVSAGARAAFPLALMLLQVGAEPQAGM